MVEAGSAAAGHGVAFFSPHCGSPVTEAARQLPRQALKTQRQGLPFRQNFAEISVKISFPLVAGK